MAADYDPIWGPGGAPPAGGRPRLSVVTDDVEQPAFVLQAARLPDPKTIPPRRWLYGTHLLKGFVSVLVAPGGTGKSSYAMAVGLCLATGNSFLGEHIFERVNVACLNLEDPIDELDRRLAALMIRHQIDETDVENRFFMHSGESRTVILAALDDDGYTVVHPDEAVLIAELKAHRIGLIIVDPFAESHTLEENSNPQMVRAAAAWRRVARAADCAVLLVHHVRKGAVADIDSARGAKALTDSARVGMLMSSMSPEDAETFGIKEDQRGRYVRLDDAKANLAPKAGKAKWFELDRVELGNSTCDYPKGDFVAAIVSWQPPSLWARHTGADLNAALDRIEQGPKPDMFYAPTKRGAAASRWVGQVLIDVLDVEDGQAKQMVAKWLESGLLKVETFRNPDTRKSADGVIVDNSKRPSNDEM
ncbi:AAA family ATPase [Acidisoma cellulosilytica]|uniref:AAA family ATPase n=1 Tax=Acidisoma cellulosilyticum TaxID=2802395 RepID=A0A963Z1I2_9PROT|nr:AAA family ATPase [Acidisoma cellulosilyticum]MCB8880103.1 AAA family ATPase [Acidisoma cellulosilyticum]